MDTKVYLERIATAGFDSDVHSAFLAFAEGMLQDPRSKTLFGRMAERSGIASRTSCLRVDGLLDGDAVDGNELYQLGMFPTTAERMRLYKRFAPVLMKRTLTQLALTGEERKRVRHVIVTSCTGFYAPGLDFDIVDFLNLDPSVERTMIGFMGCYAAINALKQARHIVRSQPEDSVLVVNLELCTLHLQETQDLNKVLSFMIFGDGCAASLVSAHPRGLELTRFHAVRLENTEDLITWHVGDQGFDMVLSGQVPGVISQALTAHKDELSDGGTVTQWAVHPGGRSVLDAIEAALELPQDAMQVSRDVLRQYGNMSSATVMFVLQAILEKGRAGEAGCAMAFGPGLTAETMHFTTVQR